MLALFANIAMTPSSDINPTLQASSLLQQQGGKDPSPKSPKRLTSGGGGDHGHGEELDIMTQIGSFFKSLIFSEPPHPAPSLVTRDTNWQASYLSPIHTKLKKEGKVPGAEKEKERDVEWLLKNHFKGVLPYFRVWEIKMEEMDGDIPTVGRGTPPFPNRPIFKREMIATQLFLKDYGKRRGLTGRTNNISEEAVEVKSLRKPSAPRSNFSILRTQSLSPEEVIKRKKSVSVPHRGTSKLIS